jgi:hypothetical protein
MVDVTNVLSEKYKGIEWSLVGDPSTESEFNSNFAVLKANGITEPTWVKVSEYKTAMQAEYDALDYQRTRKPLYPSIEDLTVALAEKAEGNSDMWDEISKKRADVKQAHPKP